MNFLIDNWYLFLAGAVALYLLKRKKDKKKDSGGSSGKDYAKKVLPSFSKGYMSVARVRGNTIGGTYTQRGSNYVMVGERQIPVPARESVYHLSVAGPSVLVAGEHVGGDVFILDGLKLNKIWGGGRDTIIWAEKIGKDTVAVSTDFNRGGITFHNISKGIHTTVTSDKDFHARQVYKDGNMWRILAFDYGAEVGGWFESTNGKSWSWRPQTKHMRLLKSVKHGSRRYFAGSPYTGGKRHGPATLLIESKGKVVPVFRVTNGHAMFFGIASDGKNLWAGTLTNWRGAGRADLYRSDGNSFKKVWIANDPEITDIWAEKGIAYVATRNEGGTGAVYEISGEPMSSAEEPSKPVAGRKPIRALGSGFIWKPMSDPHSSKPNTLVVILPKKFDSNTHVTVNGEQTDRANGYPKRVPENGNRAHYRFSKSGAAYGQNVELKVNGVSYNIPNGAARYET